MAFFNQWGFTATTMPEPSPNESAAGSFQTAIPAASKAQATEWGLVLSSQGIESTLVGTGNEDQWFLVVEAQDEIKALESIGLYRAEISRWQWRQEIVWPKMIFHWGALPWCLGLILFHLLETQKGMSLHPAGMVDSAAVLTGQWWRLFTAVTLHADVAHLASNASIGFLLFGLAMARFGFGWALLASFLAGAFGNLFSLGFSPLPHRSLGASGMIMGALGMIAAQTYGRFPRAPLRLAYVGLLTGAMLFLLLGANPNSDVGAHLGGFLGGLFAGMGLAHFPQRTLEKPGPNRAALAALLGLILYVWFRALRATS